MDEATRILDEVRREQEWKQSLALNVTLDYIHNQDKSADFKKYLEQWAVNLSPVSGDRHPISIMVDSRGRGDWPEGLALEIALDFVDRHCDIDYYKVHLHIMACCESRGSGQDPEETPGS